MDSQSNARRRPDVNYNYDCLGDVFDDSDCDGDYTMETEADVHHNQPDGTTDCSFGYILGSMNARLQSFLFTIAKRSRVFESFYYK